MNLLIDHCDAAVTIQLDEKAPIGWAAHAIECGLLWWFGRCMWRVNISRELGPGDAVWIHIHPLNPAVRSIDWSNFTMVGDMAKIRAFPMRLVEPWGMEKSSSGISLAELKGDTTVGALAYGLADIALDFFKRGATWVQAQYSIKQVQITSNAVLSHEQAIDLVSAEASYVGLETLEALPWEGRGRPWDIKPGAGKTGAA